MKLLNKRIISLLLALVMICGMMPITAFAVDNHTHTYDDGTCTECGSSILGEDWVAPDFAEGDYSMVVVPDTQNLITYWPDVYYDQMQWIADHANALNIQAVMHMGDMVNNNTATEWTICKNGLDIVLDAGIPVMPMRGNHDDSAWFNRYFDYAAYGSSQSWFGGSYHTDKLDHTYWFVTVGQKEYLILSLGWAPSWDVLTWAKGVVKANSDKSVILNCHAYMNNDGTLLDSGDQHAVSSVQKGYPDGDDVWNAFKDFPNVVLSMGGHIHDDDLITYVDKNGSGREVTALLVDRQNDDTQYGYAMLAVLTFHEGSEKVDINWYSTLYDAFYRAKNQFSITVPTVCEHIYTSKTVEATCTTPGYTGNVCSVCGYIERVRFPNEITDQFKWTEGHVISAINGNMMADKNWVASDYVDISVYESLEIVTADTVSANTTLGIAFYDANKKFISGVLHTDKQGAEYGVLIHELDVPENAVYIRSTWYSVNHEKSDGATKYTFYCKGYRTEIPSLAHNFENNICTGCGLTCIDLTSQFTDWTVGGPVVFKDGTAYGEEGYVSGTNLNLKRSDYISVEGYETIEFTVCARVGNIPGGGYAFYTDKGVEYFISEGSSTRNGNGASAEGTTIHKIEVPENAKYIRLTYWADSTSYAAAVPFSFVGYTGHAHTYKNGICTGCGVNEWDTDGDGVLEILAIGNSFSVDALEYAYQIAQNLGIEEIVIGNLYKGSCTLATHAKNAKNNTAAYAWFYNDNGTWSRDTNTWKDATEKTMGDALQERTWDFVSLQQASGSSGQPDTYNADLDYLIQYVSDNAPGAKLVWHMTWAYQQNTTHSAFPTYGKDQMTMYNAIVSAVQSKIVTNGNFDLIVPNGTAVQNSRTSLLGDTTTIDGYHMSRPYGRYLTSLMFVKAVTGLDISDISYIPSGVSAEEKQIAIESVNNAYKTHFAVTESAYQKEAVVIPEGYVQQNLGLTALGYWNSSDKNGDHNKIITTADNSKQYYATVQFTREQLPVDSVILLADGWQYRPEGWIADAVHTNRPVTTTESYVVITEEWWSNYTLRAFNISKAGLSSLSGVTEADICEAFQVYVPTRAHIHTYTPDVTAPTCTEQGYTTYTCACGDSYVADFVDATGHRFENGVCAACGAEHPNLANYEDKVISILGDSISTFAGYIPVADGFNLAHRARYPQSNLLTDVNETWWMQILTTLDAKLGINDSWAGSTVSNTLSGNSGDCGENAAMASLTRIRNLGANGTPDVILFYGGTNDIARYSQPGSFNPTTAPTQADLIATKWDSPADAYVAAILRMRHYYPNAEIVAMLPTYTSAHYTDARLEQFNAVYAAICAHYGVTCIDLRDCGITTADLPDGIHPDASGMDYITGAVLDMLLNDVEMEAGENVVYSVTHNLNDAESSLGYYKGVTHGNSFVTTITGENVTVSVTMGGVDITDTAYANGVITVPAVTGDLVITIRGQFSAGGHLQQLPENLCSGINLWTVLEHDDMYYTSAGWGYHTRDQVRSVTFPVQSGDKIYATSFGEGSDNGSIQGNGSRTNGIRVTFFLADGKVKSMAPNEVYSEFAANGYLTAPEGAIAVCVPMWTPDDSNKLHILNAEHVYESGRCGCGATNGPVITQQPESVQQETGKKFAITVKAEGEGLSYQWYYKDAGMKNFGLSSNKTSSYAYAMQNYMHNRQVYCVVTDANGNSVQTETATITRPPQALRIVEQPQDARVNVGEKFSISPTVEGEGLTYQWYVKESGAKAFKVSSVKGSAYALAMQKYMIGRQVYCVITDKYGNSVTTDVATISLPPVELKILQQPSDVYASKGEKFSISPDVQGEGLTYQWYYKEGYMKDFKVSSNKSSAYAYSMQTYMNERSVYCVITDKYGNQVQTEVVTIHLEK